MKEKPTDADIANKFISFFTTVGTMLKNEVPNIDRQVVVNNPFSMFLYQVSPAEIEKIINSFDNKYSSGDDYVSNIIVKSFFFICPRPAQCRTNRGGGGDVIHFAAAGPTLRRRMTLGPLQP